VKNSEPMEPLALLDEAIAAHRLRMTGYEVQSEALVLETLRALDYVYFKDLIPELTSQPGPSPQEVSIMQWGVNEALYLVFPKQLSKETRVFASSEAIQSKADAFIFDSGVLAMAQRQRVLLSQQLLTGFIDPRLTGSGSHVLVLEAENPSVYWDAIGRAGMSWLSNQALHEDQAIEAELERRYVEIFPELDRYLCEPSKWKMGKPLESWVRHFHGWAEVYLRRMVYQDLLGEDDVLGDHRYSEYVSVLTVISAMCQMRVCFARILHNYQAGIDIRNVLTGASFLEELCDNVADFLGADSKEIAGLLDHLTLSPRNHTYQLLRGALAWAPIVQASESFCILPSYGLDINPFLFLLHELRTRYKEDWFSLVNKREGRWLKELESLFPSPRWKCASGAKLKRNGKLVTDVDFVAFDTDTRQLALFQLKWQQPSLGDEKVRYSNGENFVEACNDWIQDVKAWLSEFGIAEFLRRAGIDSVSIERLQLFVVARYSAHFPTRAVADRNATWSDWGHVRKHRTARPGGSVADLQNDLDSEINTRQMELKPESFALPLPSLALIVNPTTNPWRNS
jgi:hypothetical protein